VIEDDDKGRRGIRERGNTKETKLLRSFSNPGPNRLVEGLPYQRLFGEGEGEGNLQRKPEGTGVFSDTTEGNGLVRTSGWEAIPCTNLLGEGKGWEKLVGEEGPENWKNIRRSSPSETQGSTVTKN